MYGSFLGLTCQGVCKPISIGFPGLCLTGNTTTVQQQTQTSSALSYTQYVMLPPRHWLASLLCCLGSLSSAAVPWLNKHSSLFWERSGIWAGLFKVTLDFSDHCCGVLLWPVCVPVVPSCLFIGKKPGCCCSLYIVFWILLQQGVWTLGGTLLWFGAIQSIDSLITWQMD